MRNDDEVEEWIPTLSHATERDVDLLLVEELYSSLDFLEWMLEQGNLPRDIASWDVKHSKRRTRSRREIDIFVEISHRDRTRSALLIENKLDATEQPDQAESYRDELNALASGYTRCAMIIVCPSAYVAQHSGFTSKFDAIVTYEDISGFLREIRDGVGSDLVLRYTFRSEILEQAIHRYRRGYVAIPDTAVGDFNARYVQLLAELAPEIVPGPSMLKPANPRESTSMIFDQVKSLPNLPRELRPRRFAHELGRGSDQRANYVAFTFAGWGIAIPSIKAELQADTRDITAFFMAKPPTKIRPKPGLVMAVATRPIDNQADFDAQREALQGGIKTASFMRTWLLNNQKLVARWRALAIAHGAATETDSKDVP